MKVLKNERGLTLVELLAVVVILGIIAAIAVPAVGSIIDNSKKDAHVANGLQAINSARLAIATESTLQPTGTNVTIIPLGYLLKEGLIESITSPDNSKQYATTETDVTAKNVATATLPAESYVRITSTSGGFNYEVYLLGDNSGTAKSRHLGEQNTPATETTLKGDNSTKRATVKN